MPPRRSARVAEFADRGAGALAPLPPALAHRIFLSLPPEARARACCVCRAWRAALADPSLWLELDVCDRQASNAFVQAAAARAGGRLSLLDASGKNSCSYTVLRRVVALNGASLRSLRLHIGPDLCVGVMQVQALLRLAPSLNAFHADVSCAGPDVRTLLRGEGAFAPLRVRRLEVDYTEDWPDVHPDATVAALAEAVAGHAALRELVIEDAPLEPAGAMGALADAVVAARLRDLSLWRCRLPADATAYLARMLRDGGLEELTVFCEAEGHLPFEPAESAAAFWDALRDSSRLQVLSLFHTRLWSTAGACAALTAALTGHPSLRRLHLSDSAPADDAADALAGATLAALVAADAPALTELDVSFCGLGGAGLAALFGALRANSHLRTLRCDHCRLTKALARDALLPAVRANTSLRLLVTGRGWEPAREAEEIVRSRQAGAPQPAAPPPAEDSAGEAEAAPAAYVARRTRRR